MRKHSLKVIFMLIFAALLLSGCGLFSSSKEDIDPPQSVTYEEDMELEETNIEDENGDESGVAGTIDTQLYLIDKHGYVVPRTFALPYTESQATQALEYLVANGPITNYLPNGFRAVLPADTSLSVNINENKVAIVDFSSEFSDYAPEDEMRILQAVTYTLTQFDSIEKVKLMMNGEELKEMPVNSTPITSDLSRSIGINMDMSNIADITNTRPVTLYYVAQTDEETYFVPVTKRVSFKNTDTPTAIVEELVKGPDFYSELYTLLMPDVELLEAPVISNGVITLNFNENILGSYDRKLINDRVLESIVLSLTEQKGITGVSILVNGEADVMNEDGEIMTEPVTRPKNVNTGIF